MASSSIDVFLTHDWGERQENHGKVSKINKFLKSRNPPIVTWFDDDQIEYDISCDIVQGISEAKIIVVFITKGYEEKINTNPTGRKGYCNLEFRYAAHLGRRMIPVIMEKEFNCIDNWKPGVLRANIGENKWIDFSEAFNENNELIEAKGDELYQRIQDLLKNQGPTKAQNLNRGSRVLSKDSKKKSFLLFFWFPFLFLLVGVVTAYYWNSLVNEELIPQVKSLLSQNFQINTDKVMIPEQGLVAFYPLDGNAEDVSGNGNHGYISGGVSFFTWDRFGGTGNASEFDGYSGFIEIAGENLDFDEEMSLSLWIYPRIHAVGGIWSNTNGGILSNGISSNSLSAGGWFFSQYKGQYSFQFLKYKREDRLFSLNDGVWNHVAIVKNTSEVMVFVNGSLILLEKRRFSLATKNFNLFIGLLHFVNGDERLSTHYFKGKLDDILIYNRPLTNEEIQGLSNPNTTLQVESNDIPKNSRINLPFEIGDTHSMELIPPCPTYPMATVQMIALDSSSQDIISEKVDNFLQASFSFLTWVYIDDFIFRNTIRICLESSPFQTNKCLSLRFREGKPHFRYDGYDVGSERRVQKQSWIHLGFAYDPIKRMQSIFVNGHLANHSISEGVRSVSRGIMSDGRGLNGRLFGLRLYSREIAAEDIQQVMFQIPSSLITKETDSGKWRTATPSYLLKSIVQDPLIAQSLLNRKFIQYNRGFGDRVPCMIKSARSNQYIGEWDVRRNLYGSLGYYLPSALPIAWKIRIEKLEGSCNWIPSSFLSVQLHMVARNRYMILNSYQSDKWEEEIAFSIPQKQDQFTVPLEFIVNATAKQFDIIHEDKVLQSFPHRIAWNLFHHIVCDWDLQLIDL